MPAAKSAKPAAESAAQSKPAKTRAKSTKPAAKSKAGARSAAKPAAKAKARAKPAARPRPAAPPLPPKTASGARCWLVKSEPTVFSIDHLAAAGTTAWEGIRNYQARNHMRDDMRVGDPVLFYHSNAEPPGVVGLARVCRAAYPDPLQFDERSRYFDPKATPAAPRWQMVDVAFVEKFPAPVALDVLRADPQLAGMLVARQGHRISVQPVAPDHYRRVAELGRSARARELIGEP